MSPCYAVTATARAWHTRLHLLRSSACLGIRSVRQLLVGGLYQRVHAKRFVEGMLDS